MTHQPETQGQTNSTMARVKAETADQHHRAERHPFMVALMRGQLSRAEYAAHLEQMLLVHRAIEGRLRHAMAHEPWGVVLHEEQFLEPHLLADIAFYGGSPTPPAAARTTALVRAIDKSAIEAPVRLLGMHYVTEGSKNGAVYIARAIRKGFGLEPGQGDRSLEPYGPNQQAKWLAFKQHVDAVAFSRGDQDAIIDGARAMFDGITGIAEDSWKSVSRRGISVAIGPNVDVTASRTPPALTT